MVEVHSWQSEQGNWETRTGARAARCELHLIARR